MFIDKRFETKSTKALSKLHNVNNYDYDSWIKAIIRCLIPVAVMDRSFSEKIIIVFLSFIRDP